MKREKKARTTVNLWSVWCVNWSYARATYTYFRRVPTSQVRCSPRLQIKLSKSEIENRSRRKLPKAVGVQISSTNKSATLRFIRKMLVEFRMSFVFKITIGTCRVSMTERSDIYVNRSTRQFSLKM